jgi:transposase
MPKTRPPYAPEFRRQMVELVRAGRDPTDLAREFEPSAQAIRNWVLQADLAEGRREAKPVAPDPALSAAEREELVRLRRENKQLRLERDILSRAAARPGSRERPAQSRPALPVHEREPGLFPDCSDGARARRFQGGLLRLASSSSIRPRRDRCGAAEADPHHPR